jgi:hypothetical protein
MLTVPTSVTNELFFEEIDISNEFHGLFEVFIVSFMGWFLENFNESCLEERELKFCNCGGAYHVVRI